MTNNTQAAPHKPSVTPRHTINTRSQGDAQMDLPEASKSASLLPPINPQVRTLNPDGTLIYNAAYLAVNHRSQTRRKALFIKISALLGDNMDIWHEALHRPEGLPANALDWSTVLLRQTPDLARSIPGNVSSQQRLAGVHQAMKDRASKPGRLVKAVLHLRTVEAKNGKIKHLKTEVEGLHKRLEDLKELLDDAKTELDGQRAFYEMTLYGLEKPKPARPGDAHSEEQALFIAASNNKLRRLSSVIEFKDCEIATLNEKEAEVKNRVLNEVARSQHEDGDGAATGPLDRAS
jgi:hypothetical protein